MSVNPEAEQPIIYFGGGEKQNPPGECPERLLGHGGAWLE